jgi:ribosomal protein L24E
MSENIVCDFCGKQHVKSIQGHDCVFIGIKVECGYGSRFDGKILNFCDEKCMGKFYRKYYKKQIAKTQEKL